MRPAAYTRKSLGCLSWWAITQTSECYKEMGITHKDQDRYIDVIQSTIPGSYRRNTQCNVYLHKLDYNLADSLDEAGSKP